MHIKFILFQDLIKIERTSKNRCHVYKKFVCHLTLSKFLNMDSIHMLAFSFFILRKIRMKNIKTRISVTHASNAI